MPVSSKSITTTSGRISRGQVQQLFPIPGLTRQHQIFLSLQHITEHPTKLLGRVCHQNLLLFVHCHYPSGPDQ